MNFPVPPPFVAMVSLQASMEPQGPTGRVFLVALWELAPSSDLVLAAAEGT